MNITLKRLQNFEKIEEYLNKQCHPNKSNSFKIGYQYFLNNFFIHVNLKQTINIIDHGIYHFSLEELFEEVLDECLERNIGNIDYYQGIQLASKNVEIVFNEELF